MSDTPRTDAALREGWGACDRLCPILERELAELKPLVEKAARDLQAGAVEMREARNEVLRADTEARRASEYAEQMKAALEDWIYFAEENYPQHTEHECDVEVTERLCCDLCERAGCIKAKYDSALAALANHQPKEKS